MGKLLFIYNTHAGKGLARLRLADMQEAFAAAGWTITAPLRGPEMPPKRRSGWEQNMIVLSAAEVTVPSMR